MSSGKATESMIFGLPVGLVAATTTAKRMLSVGAEPVHVTPASTTVVVSIVAVPWPHRNPVPVVEEKSWVTVVAPLIDVIAPGTAAVTLVIKKNNGSEFKALGA
jgi:hypothetical protein